MMYKLFSHGLDLHQEIKVELTITFILLLLLTIAFSSCYHMKSVGDLLLDILFPWCPSDLIQGIKTLNFQNT